MSESARLEHYRRRYAALRPGWTPATARFEGKVATALTESSRVLDLGCGRGGIVERLGPRVAPRSAHPRSSGDDQSMEAGHWVGVDPDYTSLRKHRVKDLSRARAGSERLPFAQATFDIVVASWVVEHLPHPATTFREIARVMRPGGSFFFLTPNAAHPLPRLSAAIAPLHKLQGLAVSCLYGRAIADTFPVAYRANTVKAIERLAVRVGLRPVEIFWIDDPSYFAWNDLTFIAAVMAELLLPPERRVHLVGQLRKEEA